MDALGLTPRRRAVGIGDEPNNASASDALGENWKSALCVTSLYDSYVAVQHENDALKDQLRQVQHANELLLANNNHTNKKPRWKRRPEDTSTVGVVGEPNDTNAADDANDDTNDDYHHLVQEIRLLRAEKSQQELLFDKRRAQLEALADQYKALYVEAQTKYQQKFELDPLEPQRVALSTRALQQALDQSVHEKEELVLAHARLQQLYQQAESERRMAAETLRDQHEQLTADRTATASRCVQAVLGKWALARVAHAWQQWRLVALSERLCAQQALDAQQQRETQQQARREAAQARAHAFLATMRQTTTQRTLVAWQQVVHQRKCQRVRVETMRRSRLRRVWHAWQQHNRTDHRVEEGGAKLATLLARHAARRAWQRWLTRSTQVQEARQQRVVDAFQAHVATLEATVQELLGTIETVTAEREALTAHAHQAAVRQEHHVQALIQDRRRTRERVSDLLFQRAQRLELRDAVRAWRQTAAVRRRRHRKTEAFERARAKRTLQQSVAHWHGVAHAQRRFQQLAHGAVQRMRLLGAYRCVAAWRAFTTARKERVATLTRVVRYMTNQHLIRSFTTWQQFRLGRSQQRQRVATLGGIVARVQLSAGFGAWKRAAAALGKQAEQHTRQQIESAWRARLAQSKRELQVLRAAFQAWQRTTRSGKRFRQLTRACAVQWQRGAQGRSFDAWRAFVVRRRGVRDALRRLVAARRANELQTAWARWRTHTLVRATDAAVRQIERERDARVQELEAELLGLRRADTAATAASAEREHQLRGALEATQTALAWARASGAQYKGAFRSVCLTRQQTRVRRACLRTWQAAWHRAKRREQLVALALARQQTQRTRLVFTKWHALAPRRERMVATTARLQRAWDRRVQHDCYRAWQRFVSHACRVRDATQTFERHARHRRCHGVLTHWRDDARKTRLLTRTLEQVWLRAVHSHMRACFTQWRERAAQLKTHDERQRRQRAVDAIRSRVCARWTARSLAHVLGAWREGVGNQKRARAGVQRLRRGHDERRVAMAFSAWQSDHTHRQTQRAWLRAWQARQEHHAMTSSWHTWKEHITQRRQDTMALLQATCRQHERALAAKHEQIVALEDHRERLRAQVQTLEQACGDVGETAAQLAETVVLTKCLCQWRLLGKANHSRKTQLQRLLQLHHTRLQQRVLGAWALEVSTHRDKQRIASQLASAASQRRLRVALGTWRSLTQQQRHTRRVGRRFDLRRARRTQRAMFREWQAFAHRSHAVNRVVAVLNKLTPTLTRRDAFVTWQLATQAHKALADAQAEKQRRVLAFLMDKQADALAKSFSAWRVRWVAHHARMETAEKMHQRMQHRRLRVLWRAWRTALDWDATCSRSVAALVRLVGKHWRRMAFHHWKAQDTRVRIATLTNTREQLAFEQHTVHQELQATRDDAMQLRQSLGALQQAHAELRDATQATASVWSARVRDAQRQLVLHTLLTHVHCVPLATLVVGTAFQRWRHRATLKRQQLGALVRCARLLQRTQQARSFSRWRRRAAACDRLATRRLRRDTRRCRSVFSAWTQVVRECAMRRRRFVVRWIETTHTLQVQTALERKTAMAFRVWQLHAAGGRAHERARALTTERETEQATQLTRQTKSALLTKWSWRAYHTHCQDLRRALTRWHATVQREKQALVQIQMQELQAESAEHAARRESGPVSETVVVRLAQSLQTLFRRLSAAQSCSGLFDAVASSLSQLSFGCASGVLYLLDPSANELWTQRRDAPQIMQAPASLGLAGCALSSLSALLVEHAVQDPRFHALVDQLAVAGVATPTAGGAGVDLFSTAIIGADGAAYGVLQIAFRPDERDRQATQMHMRLLGHACGFFVEQIVYEMVRHSRDRVRARAPQSFAKLFKQTKHWRKYFVQVEQEAQKTQQHLEQLLAEQDVLLDEKKRLLAALAQFEREQRAVAEQRETNKQQSDNHELLMKHLLTYKKKTAKIKALAQEKDRLLGEKTRELERVVDEHATYKQHVQAREWQQALLTAVSPTKKQNKTTTRGAEQSDDERDQRGSTRTHGRKHGQLLLEGADVATLQNQLVRAESDSMLLVKAVDVATRHHGDLPETLKLEVNRIALRLKKPRE